MDAINKIKESIDTKRTCLYKRNASAWSDAGDAAYLRLCFARGDALRPQASVR